MGIATTKVLAPDLAGLLAQIEPSPVSAAHLTVNNQENAYSTWSDLRTAGG